MVEPRHKFGEREAAFDGRIECLMLAYLEGRADVEACRELSAALRADPALADRMATLALHAGLLQQMPVEQVAEAPPVIALQKPRWTGPLALAAAMVVAAAAITIYVLAFSPDLQSPLPNPSPTPVATLIESAGGTLTTPHGYASEGREYAAGEYILTGGTAEFMLTSSVNVKLRGESRVVMHHDMAVSLTRGSAEFVCPKDAEGFTVYLPDGSKVIDLGTKFTVTIKPDSTSTVRVVDGYVRFERDEQSVELSKNQVLVIDGNSIERMIALGPDGTPTQSGPFDGGTFDTRMESPLPTNDRPNVARPWVDIGSHPVSIIEGTGEIAPRSGPYLCLFPGQPTGGAAIAQIVTTQPGTEYKLTCSIARNTANATPTIQIDVFDGHAAIIPDRRGDLYTQPVKVDWAHGTWREYTVRFTATSELTTIRLMEPTDSASERVGPVIDDVSLNPIPKSPAAPEPPLQSQACPVEVRSASST